MDLSVKNKQEIQDMIYKHNQHRAELQDKQNQEIDKLKSAYNQRIDQTKIHQNQAFNSVRKEHDENTINEMERQAKQLSQIQEQTQDRKTQLEKIHEDMQLQHWHKLNHLNETQTTNIDSIIEGNTESLESLNDHADQTKQKVREQLKDSVWSARTNAANALSDMTYESQSIIQRKRDDFEKLMVQRDEQFRTGLINKEVEHAKFMNDKAKNHALALDKLRVSQHQEMENEKTHLASKLKDEKENLQRILASLKESHTTSIKTLSDQSKKNLDLINKSYEESKKAMETKAQDSFYRMKSLDPKVKAHPKYYEISLAVPEHEKDLVNLNVFKREIKVSMARRFDEQRLDPTGYENSTKKLEVLTKVMNVPDILDHTKISNQYQNGVLTFFVEKM